MQLDVQQAMLDRMLFVMAHGIVIPVLDFVHAAARDRTCDLSVVGHFVSRLLAMVQRPFSAAFAERVGALLTCRGVLGALRSHARSLTCLAAFIGDALATDGVSGSAREALQRLRTQI